MSEKNPFRKISEAKSEIATTRIEKSVPEALNPRGERGQVVNDMIIMTETLGVTEAVELEPLRKLFEARIRRHILETYNKHLVGRPGSPTHHVFTEMVEKDMRHGFSLYLTAWYREMMETAPKPHKPIKKDVRYQGRIRAIKEVDQVSNDQYQRDYLTHGADVELTNSDEEHGFVRDEAIEGYSTQYQSIYPDNAEESAKAAYMFETLRIFESEFFANLNTALANKVSLPKALDFAHFCYGLRADLIPEMQEEGLTPQETVTYGVQNRISAEFTFASWKEIGKKLEDRYQPIDDRGNKHPWVRTEKMVRNYVFKYPETIEQGVQVLDEQLPELMVTYPHIPKRLLIELCLKNPSAFVEEIENFNQVFNECIDSFIVPQTWIANLSRKNVFRHYQLEPEAMVGFFRGGSKSTKPFAEALQNAEFVHASIRKIAESDGIPVSFNVTRHILRTYLLRNIPRTKGIEEARKVYARDQKKEGAVYEEVERQYPHLHPHLHMDDIRRIAELGYGTTPEERVENGALLVELIGEGKNPSEAGLQMDDCIDLYYSYIDAGFPQDPVSLQHLKDAISMDSQNPIMFYESVSKKEWPSHVPVIKSRLEDND